MGRNLDKTPKFSKKTHSFSSTSHIGAASKRAKLLTALNHKCLLWRFVKIVILFSNCPAIHRWSLCDDVLQYREDCYSNVPTTGTKDPETLVGTLMAIGNVNDIFPVHFVLRSLFFKVLKIELLTLRFVYMLYLHLCTLKHLKQLQCEGREGSFFSFARGRYSNYYRQN